MTVQLATKHLNLKLVSESFNFCDYWADIHGPSHCPIPPGTYVILHDDAIPTEFKTFNVSYDDIIIHFVCVSLCIVGAVLFKSYCK